MSDLVERVRALNPVPTCSQPSIEDVWCKLEHDETAEVGGPGELATSRGSGFVGADRRRVHARRRSVRPRFSRLGLVVAITIPVLVAAVALVGLHHHHAAAPIPGAHHHPVAQSPSQRLADGTISCYFGSSGPLRRGGRGADAGPDPATGQSPIAYCRRWYGLNAHTRINAARVKFVACQSSPTNVAVYVADPHPGQCQRLGHSPLPASYPAALERLQTLERDLTELQRRRDCTAPQALATQVRSRLSALGFESWYVVRPPAAATPEQLNSPAGTGGGPCGSLILMPADNSPSSPVAIQPDRRTVDIQRALSRSTDAFVYYAQSSLIQRTYRHCFTPTTARQLVTHAFSPAHLQPRFATTASPLGETYEPASQRLYDHGCVRVNTVYPSDDGSYVDVWLIARFGPRLPPKQPFPAAESFGG
jgi:hypothetical protein